MTFWDLWYRMARSNPALNDDECIMRIRVSVFRELMRKAYEAGQSSNAGAKKDPFDIFGEFGDLFGGKN